MGCLLGLSRPPHCHTSHCRYYYLTEVYPRATGINIISTPRWL